MLRRLATMLPVLALLLVMAAPTVLAEEPTKVEEGWGNQACDGYKIDPVEDGHVAFPDGAWFHIDVYWDNGWVFDWSSNLEVDSVVVKGGTGYLTYFYDDAGSGEGLHAPTNPKNKHGYWYGLSHLCFDGEKKK